MKHISILVPKGQFSIVNIAGSFQILNWANDMFFQKTRKQLFKIEFVGYAKPSKDFDGYYTVTPPKTINEVKKTDLIIIPAVHGDLKESIRNNREIINWVRDQYIDGAKVAAFCIGAFLLAETGILNGKSCSTHWAHARELQEMFPEINVKAENIVTESEGLYSSGGAYAFTNLVIYLIEKFGGRELAIMASKAFMIDIDKYSQSPFIIFNGQKDHKDEMVLKVQDYIETNFDKKFTVGEVASNHATIRRTLERRFKIATGNSVIEYIQRVRTEAAKKLLETGNKAVNEVMFEVGYTDSKAFREVFKKYVGLSPIDYRKRFSSVYVN